MWQFHCLSLYRCEHGGISTDDHFSSVSVPQLGAVKFPYHSRLLRGGGICGCTGYCQDKRCGCKGKKLRCSLQCHPTSKFCMNNWKKKDPFIRVTRQTFLNNTCLSDEDLKSLRNLEGALNDNHIQAAQNLLRKQFPNIAGLQSPLCGMTLTFLSRTYDPANFIQILNNGAKHWHVFSGSSLTSVNVYDSIYDHTLYGTREQIASILKVRGHEITFKNHDVDKQSESHNCGLYAIAFATELAYGGSPIGLKYREEQLRPHFESCLISKSMDRFPSATARRIPKAVVEERVQVCGKCSLPFNSSEKEAIQCSQCNVLYHILCVKVSAPQIRRNATQHDWHCPGCPNKAT